MLDDDKVIVIKYYSTAYLILPNCTIKKCNGDIYDRFVDSKNKLVNIKGMLYDAILSVDIKRMLMKAFIEHIYCLRILAD